ncbi:MULTISPECIES: glycoside hydrolase family 88 protein [unclassified Duganella]|uniref:glycoside hydrolase family 88 protein n=1 Tax=unclassified Duganella TaxID=2636909 RepID=UPI000E3520E6|nr:MULTISPECIES: glycoside hydrolase family 88 protein [unclassified Duganella]RFP18709.1 glucuronyl hydrolase [Duganella sp. BJB475]RFP35374.1 glucuronyl hydrolase [Duganella sp. BJB476]
MTTSTAGQASALTQALRQIDALLPDFASSFPGDTTEGQHYQPRQLDGLAAGANVGWTTGFWTGQLWLAYAATRAERYKQAATVQTASFMRRLAHRDDLGNHDIGFLYQLSCIPADVLAAVPGARKCAIEAAELLLQRFLPGAGVIQSWGTPDDPQQRGRVIIDGAMNLPLLHWAARATDRAEFRHAAASHLERMRQHLVRPDGATYHTVHLDPVDGSALRISTHQGLSDQSCWARGQAWAIYGFALNHRQLPELKLLHTAIKTADYFLAHLPADGIALWDLSLAHDSGEPRDSSAVAIAVCGLQEIVAQLEPGSPRQQHYAQQGQRLLDALITHCAGARPACDGLLRHGVYHRLAEAGVDEATLWGDYYYLEALMRAERNWTPYFA